ncbi:MAG: hypothetical protein E7289_01330 [Lachnospiraceae bacterium]|nr:hypothetical protein [Lachnospiraceae bacterium]
MNKVVKGILIAVLACAAIYFVPRIVLSTLISNFPERKTVVFLDDHSLKDEKTYKVEKENIVVHIPTYYNNCQEVKELSSFVCDAHVKNKQLLVIYRPFDDVADKIMPGYSKEYRQALAKFENSSLPFPLSITHKTPDDLFEVMKVVYSADKNDFNFWNLSESLYLHHLLTAREEAEKESMIIHALYERDNIRAIVAEDSTSPGTYAVLIVPDSSTGNIYAMVIKTSDMDDITKLLNTYEFK